MIVYKEGKILNSETGEVYSNDVLVPKFSVEVARKNGDIGYKSSYSYADYINEFPEIRYIEVMKASDVPLTIPEDKLIYEIKYDGFRTNMFVTSKGNRFFSRNISKENGWWGESSDNLVHIRDFEAGEFKGTILDAEATTESNLFKDVAGICSSSTLPQTALNNQLENGFSNVNCFDITYYKGLKLTNFPLWKRKIYLAKVLYKLDHPSLIFVTMYCNAAAKEYIMTQAAAMANVSNEVILFLNKHITVKDSRAQFLQEVWDRGEEGLIAKDIDSSYEQRRSNSWIKFKPLFFKDVVIMGYNPPTMMRGDEAKTPDEEWEYWYHPESDSRVRSIGNPSSGCDQCDAVSKPFFMGWIGSVICGVWREGELIEVANVKGFSDEALEYIKNNESDLIGSVIEIKFNDFTDATKSRARHPRHSKFRNEDRGGDYKNSDECDWDSWILS